MSLQLGPAPGLADSTQGRGPREPGQAQPWDCCTALEGFLGLRFFHLTKGHPNFCSVSLIGFL